MGEMILSTVARAGPAATGWAIIGLAAVVLFLLILMVVFASRGRAQDRSAEAIVQSHAELQGRLAALTEIFGQRQHELNRLIGERLDGMSGRIGSTLQAQAQATHHNLERLQERLAVIDAAQGNIQMLARDMAGLQAILANKQTRGAFGQVRMEAIIADGLPMGAYAFQATLSNGTRPDCLVHMPNGTPGLVIDAKFPLEGWNAFRDAKEPERKVMAGQQFRRDMELHIRAIADKYLIAGETQETAFLFVPSESIFADIHESFEAVVQKAQRARIMIVSPSLLMLSVQLMQAIMKDQRMREQAHLIQAEVAELMQDLGRLDERVGKLQGHFSQAQRDVDTIVTSTGKITRRGERIAGLDLAPPAAPPVPSPPSPGAVAQDTRETARFAESRTGSLRLKVVDEE